MIVTAKNLVGAMALVMCGGMTACDTTALPVAPTTDFEQVDLPVGTIADQKADGGWGFATTCKEIPTLEPLVDPMIVVSLDGLTVHLFDRAGSYDKVFPVGPGAIENGKSLTPTSESAPEGLFHTRTDLPAVVDGPTPGEARWGWNHACRMWWSDDSGNKVPVFAGLPFIRLLGPSSAAYGLHGPVDNFHMASGGTLRRGFVSHGCMRMQAADIVELYARIQGHKTPVRIQKAEERRSDDRAVDIEDTWMGSECRSDADCTFSGGLCRANAYSGRSFCTKRCDRYCPDRYGYPTTFCVEDEESPGNGICVNKVSSLADGCNRFDHLARHNGVARNGQPWRKADVCLPGSEGWLGDRCVADGDCSRGFCRQVEGETAGLCTESCTRYCPDLAGHATTFCVDADQGSGLDQGMCVAQCGSNEDCPMGTTCEEQTRHGQSWVVRSVCLPL